MLDFEQIIRLLNSGGVLGLLVLILLGGQRQWWVWGWQHRESIKDLEVQLERMTEEKNLWRDLSLRTLNVAEGATTAAKKADSSPWR